MGKSKNEKNEFIKRAITRGRIWKDVLITIGLLTVITLIGYLYSEYIGVISYERIENIVPFYILAIVLIARYTEGYLYGIVASLISVVCVNFLFTYPYFVLNFTLAGYPVTFMVMLAIATITSTTTTHMKQHLKILSEREKQLIEAEKEKMRANLLRAISHDLRTPLTSIIGASNLYLDNEDQLTAEKKREMMQNIREDSNWLLNMVENLLSVTRIQDGVANVKKSSEIVEEVLSESVVRLRKRLPDADISVQVPGELLMIPMDAMLIEQVLINLMENAVIHAKSTKPIKCYVTEDENNAIFHVRDYGIGIADDRIDTIFDGTMYGIIQSADSKRGMGIGLYICKTIVVAHNGEIFAKNCQQGSEFFFTLPKGSEITA